ncbi:hypothetical protein F5883DRAFT_122807 [Diaporthe sp. PMI_573]|nr:hypothetical protein F5883DRAFT_122807 [Diaporthaceae sp. PMI_573]
MCGWTKVTFICDHIYYRAETWCPKYAQSHRPCPPEITSSDFKEGFCSRCPSHRRSVAWEELISRKTPVPYGEALKHEPPTLLFLGNNISTPSDKLRDYTKQKHSTTEVSAQQGRL